MEEFFDSEKLRSFGPIVIALIVVALSSIVGVYVLSHEGHEYFEVKLPAAAQDHNGNVEILEEPTIHKPHSSIIQCYCPANGKLLGHINPATADGIDRAIERAKAAQVAWARTSFAQRRQLLRTLLKYILKNQDDIVRVACLDSGKTRVDASFGEVLVTAEKLAWTIKHGERYLRPESRPTNLLMCYKRNEVRFEPLGVVAACVSWNYPFHNLLNPIISALFCGNAIIVKPSERTAWSAQFFISIVQGALRACNFSPSLVQSLVCWPSAAAHLTAHPSICHLTFIGSRPIGHLVASSAANSLTPLCMELGGKDAALILDDKINMPKIVSILMRGVFQAAGQNCIGIERVIALPGPYERILELVVGRIKSLRLGSALDEEEDVDVGACISDANFDNLEGLIQDAIARGAKLLCGGSRYLHPKWPKGHYFSPTLLVGVTRDMPIAQTELFGPIFVLMRAESVTDAIEIANSTPYGLGCSVFGSQAKELETVTNEVKVGMVSVNDFASYYLCGLPFGGVRGSGYGRFGGPEGLRGLCNEKSVCTDRFASTSIPPRLDYRVKDEDGAKSKAWGFVTGIVEFGYGVGLKSRVDGILKLIRNA